MVGLIPEQAKERGIRVSETSLLISVAGSSLYADGYSGWAQMVVDEDRGVPVGFTFAGPGVRAELGGRSEGRNAVRVRSESLARGLAIDVAALSARSVQVTRGARNEPPRRLTRVY